MAQFKDKGVRRKKAGKTHPAEFKVREELLAGLDVNDPTVLAWWKSEKEKNAADARLKASTDRPKLGRRTK